MLGIYLLAKFTKVCKVIGSTLVRLEFLWKSGQYSTSHRDITWYNVYLSKGSKLKNKNQDMNL